MAHVEPSLCASRHHPHCFSYISSAKLMTALRKAPPRRASARQPRWTEMPLTRLRSPWLPFACWVCPPPGGEGSWGSAFSQPTACTATRPLLSKGRSSNHRVTATSPFSVIAGMLSSENSVLLVYVIQLQRLRPGLRWLQTESWTSWVTLENTCSSRLRSDAEAGGVDRNKAAISNLPLLL